MGVYFKNIPKFLMGVKMIQHSKSPLSSRFNPSFENQ